MLAFPLEADNLLFRTPFIGVFGSHLLELLQTLNGALNGHEICKQPSQPALIHIVHAAPLRLLGDSFLSLALGSDKQDGLALRSHLGHKTHGVLEQLQGLLKVNDVNPIAFAKDVLFHLWIPALGLVPEVNAGFEQFLHRNRRQTTSFTVTFPL